MLTVLGHRLDLLTGEQLPVVMARVSATTGEDEGCYAIVKLEESSFVLKVDGDLKLPPYTISLPVVIKYLPGHKTMLIVEIANHERVLGRHGSKHGTFYKVLEIDLLN